MAGLRSWLGLADDDDPVQKALGLLGQGGSAPEASYNDPTAGGTLAQPLPAPSSMTPPAEPPYQPPFAPEQAQPRDPFPQPLRPGTERPIVNGDGSVTTERSITVTEPDLNGGLPTNIPTVWNGRVVSDDEAVQNAARSGVAFPSFGSVDEAVRAAEQRSRDLGSGRATSVGGASVPWEVQNALPNRNRAVRGGPLDEGVPPSTSYNDPTAGGTLSRPLPPSPEPAAPPWASAVDLGSRALGAVGSAATGLYDRRAAEIAAEPAAPDLRVPSATNPLAADLPRRDPLPVLGAAATRAGTGLYGAAQDPRNAMDTVTAAGRAAATAGMEAATAPADLTTALPSARGLKIVQDAINAGGTEVGRRVGRAMGLTDQELFRAFGMPVSGEDIAGFVGGAALDPTNYIGAGEARTAAHGAEEAARGIGSRIRGAPAEGGVVHLGSGVVPAPQPGAGALERAAQIAAEGGPASSVKKYQYLGAAGADSPEQLAETLRTVPMVTTAQARETLGDRPDYLAPVAQFLLEQRQKALSGGMTARDVAKAYYMTLMSMRSSAQEAGALERKVAGGFTTGAGEVIPPNPGLGRLDQMVNVNNGHPLGDIFTEANPRHGGREVRPESMGAAWLWTEDGQRALNGMSEGEFIPDAWERGRHARLAFGSDTVGGNGALRPLTAAEERAGKVNMTNLPGFVDELNAGIASMKAAGRASEIGGWLTDQAQRLNGIGAGKSAFIKQLLGFGDAVTIDAREINYWLSGRGLLPPGDRSPGAQLARASGQWWDNRHVSGALQPRIQQEVMRLQADYPELTAGLDPADAAHILHHWIWDKAGGSATRHTDVMASQRLAAGAAPVTAPGLRSAAYNAAQGGVLGATSEELQAQQEGRPADYGEEARRALIGGGLAAAAGNRGAREAVTHALGAGFVPRGPTVEVLQDTLGAVRRQLQEARQAVGAAATREEHQAASAAVIQAQTEEGRVLAQLQQARQQRRSLEPRIAAEVGPRLQDAGSALGPADAEMLADVRYPRERVRSDMQSSIGPVDDAPRTASVGSGFVPAEDAMPASDAMRASDGMAPGQAAEREAARAHLSPVARRVVGAYDLETPRRAASVADRAVQIAADGIARKIPRRGGMEGSPHELMARVHEAVVRNLDDTKVVMTGLNPGALRAFLGGQGLTSKAETGDLGLINQITQGQVNVAGGRAKIIDGKKVTVPYTLEDAADFAQRESEQMRGVTGGTRFPDPQTGAIDREAPRVLYAYVSEGQPLVGPNVPTLGLVWKPQTPRVSSVNHPFGAFSRGQDIHVNMAGGNKALVYDPAAIAGARHAPAAMSGGRLVEAPRGAPTSGDLAFDWERAGIDVGDGRKIADTHLLVGADGESSHRASALVSGMSNDLQAAIARGTMDDPEQVAAVLMRGGAPKWKPGWGAVQNPTRTESLILDPDLANVQAIYITGLRKNLERNLEGGGKTGERITELDMARRIRAAIKDQTGEDVPILYNDIGRQAVSAPNVKAGLGTNEGWAPTLISDAEVLEGPPLTLSPGRQRIVDEYTQATDPATGKPYMNLGGQVPFDPSGAALGAGAGAASEDDQGQQADPWRTAGGLVLGGVAGKRFPGVEKALARAQAGAASRAARMAANPELRRPSAPDWFKSLGFSGIYGPATAANSVIGGAQELLLAQPKEALRALVEGRPVVTGAQARRQVSAVGEGLANLGRVIMGSSPDAAAAASGGSQGTAGLSARVVNPAGHAAARVLEKPGEILTEAPDALFRPQFIAQGEGREAQRVAKENGFTGDKAKAYVDALMGEVEQLRAHPTTRSTSDNARRVLAAGAAYADQLGYKGKPGKLGQRLADFAKQDNGWGVLASFAMPFPGMASKMTEGAARITPGVGLLPSVRRGQASRFDVAYDQGLGTLAAAGIAAWAMQGGITGSGPDDPEKRQQMLAQGWQPNSVLVGDHFISTRVFQKFQPLLDTAGELHDGLAYGKKDRKYSDIVGDMVKRASRIAVDQTGLSGLADLHDLMNNADAMGPGFVARSAVRYLPWGGVLRAAAAAMDPVQRRASKWGDEAVPTTAIGEGIETAIPGLRQNVAPAQDVLGRPMENPQRGLLGAILPRTTTLREDPLIKEFQAAGVDIAAAPSDVDGVPLSAAQQRRYTEVMGRELQRLAGPSMASGTWRSMDPATRKLLLETFQGTARTLAGVAVASEGGQDFNAARTKAIIEKAAGR